MLRRLILSFTCLGLLAAGCRPKSAPPEAAVVDPAVHSSRVAVLLFEDNLDFAATDAPGAGQAVYQAQVEGLVEALRKRGVPAERVVVPPEGVDTLDLAGYGAAVIVDTFMILPKTRAQLEVFVEQGGVLVGFYEVGRFPGAWVDPWPFAEFFGLKALIPSIGGAGVLAAPAGFYQIADVVDPTSPLMVGLNRQLNWGEQARHVWPVVSAGATVVAVFPRQLVLSPGHPDPVVVEESLPAVTDQRRGRGRAVYVSVLPPGRTFGGWDGVPDALTVVANAVALAAPAPVEKKDRPAELALAVNQLGYAPRWPRTVVVRVRGGATNQPVAGTYSVRNEAGAEVATGVVKAWPGALWHSRHATVDLTALQDPGRYQLAVEIEGTVAEQSFRVLEPGVASTQLGEWMLAYLDSSKCGVTCHQDAPLAGGLHATTDDSTVRLEDMLDLVQALTWYVERRPDDARMAYEFERALMWCWRMRGDDGMPAAAVRPVGEAAPGVKARDDQRPREIERLNSVSNAVRYAAIMARAVKPAREHISLNLAQELSVAAERAYRRIREEPLVNTADIGWRLWAAVEVYRLNQQPDYLEDAQREVTRLFARQLDRDKVPGTSIYGDFYADGERSSLSPLQYERHRAVGLYRGLMEVYRVLPEGTTRDDVRSVLDRFMQGFLLNGSALSPYGQLIAALEPMGAPRPRPGNRGGFEPPESFQIRWFAGRSSPVGESGLNADLLTLSAIALEWARETGQAPLEQLALQQLNWLLGVNPLGLNQLAAGPVVPGGITGRADHPVWTTASVGRGEEAPNAALLSVLAALPDDAR